MASETIKILAGSIPTSRGAWATGAVVYKFNRFTYLGCEWEAEQDGLTNAPGTIVNGVPVPNTGWRVSSVGASSEVVAAVAALQESKADISDLTDGTVVPALADNLSSWEGSNLTVDDTWSDVVRTTAGDVSIDSSEQGRVVSIVAKTLTFSATSMIVTGFNLLRNATGVGAGYYFLVPALPFGTFGTASKPNGLLFTDASGANIKPTVRWKAIANGVPTSVSDGVTCPYTDSNGYRFFNPSGVGYIIVSGITYANTCAHIAWSGRYDEFVSPTASTDAGTTVPLTSLINAVHSYGQLLNVGGLADRIEWTGDTSYTWTRNNDRISPTWTNTLNEDGTTYTHTATISTMLSGGTACLADGTYLDVDGTTVSIVDSSSASPSGYVYFNLATPATGTGTADRRAAMEDWGLEEVVGAVGEAYITTQYRQGIPDTLRALASVRVEEAFRIIAEALNSLDARLSVLVKTIGKFGRITADAIDATTITSNLYPVTLVANGAPSASLRPTNIGDELPWDGVPVFEGQVYIDKTNKKVYTAVGFNAIADWIILN